MEIRDVVGAREVVSGRSRLVPDDPALFAPTLIRLLSIVPSCLPLPAP
jgi:hypothetical protein